MLSLRDLHAARAPFAGFAIIGIGWGGFAAQVPEIKAQIGASDSAFGVAMLMAAAGAVLALWLAPWALRVLGRGALLIPAGAMVVGFVVVGLTHDLVVFTLAMLLCSSASGTLDVLTNARTSDIEEASGRPLMSFGHATFSFAYALAALAAGGMRELAWPSGQIFLVLAMAGLLLCVWIVEVPKPSAAPNAHTQNIAQGQRLWQRLLVWAVGAVLILAFMAEQSTEGWSALHLERSLGASAAGGATGPALLGVTMCIGRLAGQMLLRWTSGLRLMAYAGALSALGGFIACLAPSVALAYIGFALLGLGISVLVPLAYAHIGARTPSEHRAKAIAEISVIGYAAFFMGPPLMGGLSEAFGLDVAFGAMALAVLMIPLVLVPLLSRLDLLKGRAHAS